MVLTNYETFVSRIYFSKIRGCRRKCGTNRDEESWRLRYYGGDNEIFTQFEKLHETLVVQVKRKVTSQRSSWQCNRLVIPLQTTFKLL